MLLSLLLTNRANAVGYFYDCEKLLATAVADLPERLAPVDLDQAGFTPYRRTRATLSDAHSYFTFDSSEGAHALTSSLHAALDLITSHMARWSPAFPQDMQALKNYTTLWMMAYTDPNTGDLRIGDRALENSSGFAELEMQALEQLSYLSDEVSFQGVPTFKRLAPIPIFSIGNLDVPWVFRAVPATNGGGFQIVIANRHSNQLGPNNISVNGTFLHQLSKDIFNRPLKVSASDYHYSLFNDSKPGGKTLGTALVALHKLNTETGGQLDMLTLAKTVASKINANMFLSLCREHNLCGLIDPFHLQRFLRRHPSAAASLVANEGETYLIDENISLFKAMIEEASQSFYGRNRLTNWHEVRLWGWNHFFAIASSLTGDYKDASWRAAVGQIRSSLKTDSAVPYEHNSYSGYTEQFFDTSSATLLGDRISPRSISMQHQLDYEMFEKQLFIKDVGLQQLSIRLVASPAALAKGDLSNSHFEVLLARMLELLDPRAR